MVEIRCDSSDGRPSRGCADTVDYVRASGTWKRASGGATTVVRNSSTVLITAAAYADIGPGFGSPTAVDGITWTANHFEVAAAGRYRLEVAAAVQGGAGLFIGASDKATLTALPGDLIAYSTIPQIQGDAAGVLTREVTLAAGAPVYLWGLVASGSGTLRTGVSTGTPAAVGQNQYAKLERIG